MINMFSKIKKALTRGATNGGVGGTGSVENASINGTVAERTNGNGHVRIVVTRN